MDGLDVAVSGRASSAAHPAWPEDAVAAMGFACTPAE